MKAFILSSLLFLTQYLCAQVYVGDKTEITQILKNIESFSKHYMDGDIDALANAYSLNGKILPAGTTIIEGREAIKKKWVLPENVKILNHKVSPKEITITGEHAYDIGYYEGSTLQKDGKTVTWKGKYVIVWKKEDNDWKIYIDMWNRVD